jgi:Tfp pilus assembly protein PilF
MRRPRFFFVTILSTILASISWNSATSQTVENNAQVIQLIHSGGEATRRGDLSGAETIFRRAVELAPTLSDGYLGLGLVQLRRGELDDAIKSLVRATELNPQLPGAHMFLGIAQYHSGLREPAASSLRAEIALKPDNTEALTWLGIVELGGDHPEQATVPLDRAAALSPKDPHVLYYCAHAHMLVAESAYRRLSALDPDSSLVHRGLAESYEISGQPEKALAEYEAAVKKDPANPDLYESLGEADQKMGRIDAAKTAYEEELKLDPHSAIALYNVGRIDVERGKPELGVAALLQAEAAHATPAPTDFYLGLGLAELGQSAEAAQWLEKALTSQPSPFIQQSALYQLARVYQKLDRKADAQHALDRLRLLVSQRQKEVSSKPNAGEPSQSLDAPAPADQP